MRPVAVVGNLAIDIVEGAPERVGGGTFHGGRALRLLHTPARIVTKCATADRARLLPPVAALGLPVSSQGGESTVTFRMSYEGDVRSMEVLALGDPWTPEEARGWVNDALARVEWVHVAPLLRSDFPAETLRELARGRRLSYDAQGLVRPAHTGPLVLDDDFDPEVLRHVSVLKLADDEAEALFGGEPSEADLQALGVPEVLVTQGSRGVLVFAGGRIEHVPARPLTGDVDPTGAGDAFSAAYVSARNGGHAPVPSARRAGALVAGLIAVPEPEPEPE
jgi:sugar/nucleoside kinase (ribokinase family)